MFNDRTRAINALLRFSLPLVLVLGAAADTWGADATISAQLQMNKDVGVAFNAITRGFFDVVVNLIHPYDWSIVTNQQSSVVVSKAGDTIWNRTSADANTHVWEGCGVTGNCWPGVLFAGQLTRPSSGGGNGYPPGFNASVADIDIQVDALGLHSDGPTGHWPPCRTYLEHAAEHTEGGGLVLPSSLVTGTFPVQLPASSPYKLLSLTLHPRWTGTPSYDGNVGSLAFSISGQGIALYRISDGTQATSIRVPPNGLTENFAILSNETFSTPGCIAATFTWDSNLQGGPASTTDYALVWPMLYDMDVIDAQAFGPTITPGLSGDPTAGVDGSWRRTGVFSDGTSVLVIRVPNATAVGLDFSINSVGADPNTYPQTPAFIGSLSAAFPSQLPAPDQGAGACSVSLPANTPKVVYYRPPNNFFFGRQGQQCVVVGAYLGDQEVARQVITLTRPTIFLNHGVLSSPSVMQPMGGTLTAQGMGGSGGGGAIRSLYLDWSDINTSGYDTVPGRLYAGVVPEIQSELQYNRTLGIAATRMDFVGHSMGGVIVKWYASDLGNLGWGRRNNFPAAFWSGTTFQYKRNNNFGVGDVRRLISVGSPFRGSPLADAVSNTLGFNQFRTNLLNITGLVNGDTCAADDLGMSSTATAILSGAHPAVSWFPIVGFGAPNLTEVALFNGNQCLYTLARALGITPGQIAPLGLLPCNSDFVVDQWSQVDRPLNGASPVHWGQACSVTHLQEMTNPLVANYIVGALDLYFNSPTAPGYQAGYNTFNSSF